MFVLSLGADFSEQRVPLTTTYNSKWYTCFTVLL